MFIRIVGSMKNRQIQRHHAVATLRVCQNNLRSVVTLRISITINPRVAIALSMYIRIVGFMINRQIQRHHAVAT